MRIIIIGNGIAGITAARHIRKIGDDEIIVVSAESKYFFSRTALMYVYMGHMEFKHTQPYENWFWKKNRIQLVHDYVTNIDPSSKKINLKSGEFLKYDKLILATGSNPIKLDIQGTSLKGVQSLYSKQDLELIEQNTEGIKKGIVIGGGLIGVEMAEMLHSRGIHVTMVVREESFWNNVLPSEESQLVTDHIKSRGIDLVLGETVSEIKGKEKVETVTLSSGKSIETDFVGVTIGVTPNINVVKNSGIEVDKGILVDNFLTTNLENIYAIGDCAQLRTPDLNRRAIEPVWYTGRKMGEVVAENVSGNKEKFNQGLWFNSAKFFDLEYQTYGYVPNETEGDLKHFYWEDKKRERGLRLVANSSNELIGINSIGLRINHDVCDEWITSKVSIDEAIDKIDDLNFNPEFFGKLSKMLNLIEIA